MICKYTSHLADHSLNTPVYIHAYVRHCKEYISRGGKQEVGLRCLHTHRPTTRPCVHMRRSLPAEILLSYPFIYGAKTWNNSSGKSLTPFLRMQILSTSNNIVGQRRVVQDGGLIPTRGDAFLFQPSFRDMQCIVEQTCICIVMPSVILCAIRKFPHFQLGQHGLRFSSGKEQKLSSICKRELTFAEDIFDQSDRFSKKLKKKKKQKAFTAEETYKLFRMALTGHRCLSYGFQLQVCALIVFSRLV